MLGKPFLKKIRKHGQPFGLYKLRRNKQAGSESLAEGPGSIRSVIPGQVVEHAI
jgi:hypothetical protein